VRTDGDIEIFGQQIDLSTCKALHEVNPWVLAEELHDDVAKRELSRTDRCCKSYDTGKLRYSLPRVRLGLLSSSYHESGVPVELLACLCGAEVARSAIEQANSECCF